MSGIVIGFYGLSIILFLGMIHYLVATSKQGMYPPKNLLKKRANVLCIGGIITLIIGILLQIIGT